jgi:hypothetical protein
MTAIMRTGRSITVSGGVMPVAVGDRSETEIKLRASESSTFARKKKKAFFERRPAPHTR